MPRTTKRTMRKYPPLARALIESANELDKRSRALRRIAEKVASEEFEAESYRAAESGRRALVGLQEAAR